MIRQSSWTRWPMLTNGAFLAILGGAYLATEFLLPQLAAATEQAQGIGIYDPALQGDPVVAKSHSLMRTVAAVLFVFTGSAHVLAAALYRRTPKVLWNSLVIAGSLSLVPTSVVLAWLTLVAANRPRMNHSMTERADTNRL